VAVMARIVTETKNLLVCTAPPLRLDDFSTEISTVGAAPE
jgi:hypothetical protein